MIFSLFVAVLIVGTLLFSYLIYLFHYFGIFRNRVLEKDGVRDLLFILLETPSLSIIKLEDMRKLQTNRLEYLLTRMELVGFISQQRDDDREIKLTSLGKEVAEQLI